MSIKNKNDRRPRQVGNEPKRQQIAPLSSFDVPTAGNVYVGNIKPAQANRPAPKPQEQGIPIGKPRHDGTTLPNVTPGVVHTTHAPAAKTGRTGAKLPKRTGGRP